MSATLTWAHSGLGTKTGTAIGNYFADLVTLITAVEGGASFSWELAGSNTGSTPYWVVLKRKDASAGRILIVSWSSAPAGNNAAILEQAPVSNQIYIAWFPNGNVDTASNLTASSGTILGDDTDCTLVCSNNTLAGVYGTSYQHFYADSAEGCVFATQNPTGAATAYMMGAGLLVVDEADTAYDCAFGFGSNNSQLWGSSSSSPCPWTGSTVVAGSAAGTIKVHYGSNNKRYFFAWMPSAAWGTTAPGSTDILADDPNNFAWFVPTALLGQTKGEGFVLKFRQIGYGPTTVGAFTEYATTGPVVQAKQFNAYTLGASAAPWLVNFKL